MSIENYGAINLGARNCEEKSLDIGNYGEIDLDFENYRALDPDV